MTGPIVAAVESLRTRDRSDRWVLDAWDRHQDQPAKGE